MSVKTEMMRAVMNVIAIRKGISNLEDNDIAFLEAAGNYGASIDRDNAAFGQNELNFVVKGVDAGGTGAYKGPTGVSGVTGSVGDPGVPMPKAAPLPAYKGAAPQPAEIDRGPEPQTVGDTLDPSAPNPATSNQDVNQDEDQPVMLSTKRS